METQQGQYFSFERGEMLDLLPSGVKSILDVGCGEGNFGESAKRRFSCTVWGVEPEAGPSQKASQKLDKVINALFDSTLKIEETFDAIVFNDVLEHMSDPWSALQYAKQLLKPDGVIIASIPNILYFHDFSNLLISKDWAYQQAGIFDKTHLRFFTKKSMRAMFEDCGLNIVDQRGIHPTDSKKFLLFNLLTLGYWKEAQFLQFSIKATR